MTLRLSSMHRRLRLADPELNPFRNRLSTALKDGSLAPPSGAASYLAVGADMAFGGARDWLEPGTTPLLVLEGPTPLNAQRLPASLVLLPVREGNTGDKSLARVLAMDLVRSVKEQSKDSVDFAGVWQSCGISREAAGEPELLGMSGKSLEQLLTAQDGAGEKHPFWSVVREVSLSEGVSLPKLVNHLLTRWTIWYSPYTAKTVTAGAGADLCRTMVEHWQENDRPAHCFGAQYWNHPSIRATFSGKGGDVRFHETREDAIRSAMASGGRILSWAGRTDSQFEGDCVRKGIPLVRIEDGFLRSVGLGAGLARGAMLAVDDLGIYYDPSRPSRLEVLLQNEVLQPQEVQRGEALIRLIREAKVSKYNFGSARHFNFPADRKKILVPGQVADDAAIRKSRSITIDCANTPNVNLDLLRVARARHPDAYLVFKPHPDVETGLRKGKLSRQEAMKFADEIAEDANIIDLIEAVDRVETFSSLSGFEALLRGKSVSVHGAPFYAGWGLCEDLTPLEGRARQRSLPELVYLALVKYARTIDPVTLLPCSPEFLVARLAEQRTDRRHLLISAARRHASWLGRKLGL